MLEGEPFAEDRGLDSEEGGTEFVPTAPARRKFSIPEGLRAFQVSNLTIGPSLESSRVRAGIGRLFQGMNFEIIPTDNNGFNLVAKPGRPVNTTLLGNAFGCLAEQHPHMMVMGIGPGAAVE